MTEAPALGGRVRRGLMWSLLNSTTLRFGTLVTGIVLARILAPEDFGIYAIALTVQMILQNFSELGLSADLVRHGDIDKRGPTIATLSVIASSILVAIMFFTAGPVASGMGSSAATPVIQLMSVTLLLAGLGVVPYSHLLREFMQAKLFAIDATSFVLTTGITISLAVAGFGPMSLAIARVIAQIVTTTLQFVLAKKRFRIGWDPAVARTGLRFGFPLAVAGLLAIVLLNLDNILVGHLAGAVVLGFYVLAFNISSWPTTVIGTAIRAVAMPAFAQRADDEGRPDQTTLVEMTKLTWAAALLIGAGLVVLAKPTIELLYGSRWLPAAAALAGLGAFGALRVVFDLWVAYFTADGKAGALLWTQAAWIVTLAPVMYVSIQGYGLAGAGWAHFVVAFAAMLPFYLVAMRRAGVATMPLLKAFVVPALVVVPAGVIAAFVVSTLSHPFLQLLAGGAVLTVLYAAAVWPWLRRQPFIVSQRHVPRHAAVPRTRHVAAEQRIPAIVNN